MLGHASEAEALFQKANAMRKGRSRPFEQYYQGLYYFMSNQQRKALPLLEGAATDDAYQWNAIKFFAIMELDGGYPADAARIMKPYRQAEITDSDQAYVIASLRLAEGDKAGAQALVDKYSPGVPPFWKARFDKLQVQINSR
jgi:hypothetical protein